MADAARGIQEILMLPNDPTFKSYVRRNYINNTRVTTKDIDSAKDIYDPSTSMLKGKTHKTQCKQPSIDSSYPCIT